jgi:hypothetical protein
MRSVVNPVFDPPRVVACDFFTAETPGCGPYTSCCSSNSEVGGST